ncbi:MAG: Fic family protein [Coriobacteriales bacterium]|jgi:Fic family protein|nr:Fic family protein [Coriobacteriales bacterium]
MRDQGSAYELKHLVERFRKLAKGKDNALRELVFAELPDMVYNSNAIENSSLSLEDTESILMQGIVPSESVIREVYEVKNLAQVTERLYAHSEEPLSTTLLLEMHALLLQNINPEWAGRFRHGDEWVRVGAHVGANPDFVSGLVSELLNQYNAWENTFTLPDGNSLLAHVAHFHAEFETIHPFRDGNGRMGRALLNHQLHRFGLPPIIVRNKGKEKDYYPLFARYEQSGDFSGFTKLFTTLLQESLHKRIAQLTTRRIISVSDWARQNDIRPNVVLNKAKRQTLPAFRLRGKWMIDADASKT